MRGQRLHVSRSPHAPNVLSREKAIDLIEKLQVTGERSGYCEKGSGCSWRRYGEAPGRG